MYELADAHIHLFSPGFVDLLPDACRRTAPDELTLYTALAKRAGISHALVIGFEGMPAHEGNNQYLSRVLKDHPNLHGTAFVTRPQDLSVEQLETWRAQKFVGISIYLLDPAVEAAVRLMPAECWDWIAQHRWLVSVNSRGKMWSAWSPILDRHPDIRLLASHLGLPPAQATALPVSEASQLMQPVAELSRFPNTYIKLSALYAMTKPGWAYPHQATWPYVEVALGAFGADRMLWASDFSPSLEYVSFDQTLAVLNDLPFLNEEQRRLIGGANLLALLKSVKTEK